MQLPGLRSTVLHYTAQLTSLAERIHTLNYSVQTLSQAQHELVRSQIRLELAEWQSNLPASCSVSTNATRNLQPHVINLNIAGWYLLVLLYRSHFREPSSDGSEENSPASICLVASYVAHALPLPLPNADLVHRRKVLNLLKVASSEGI